jgi:CheY-like chemotaxis protein
MFHQIDRSLGVSDDDLEFVQCITSIVIEGESNVYCDGRTYNFVADDGWKYSVFVTMDSSLTGIKVNIPYNIVNERVGSYTDTLILQSHLCSNHHVKHIKVLMIDDSAVTCKVAKKLIERTGNLCDIMYDVRNLIGFEKRLLTDYYNIILVDIKMPNINGFQACKILRAFVPGNVHLIGTSSDKSDDCTKRCASAGFTLFLPKPYNMKNVVDMLYMYKVMTSVVLKWFLIDLESKIIA